MGKTYLFVSISCYAIDRNNLFVSNVVFVAANVPKRMMFVNRTLSVFREISKRENELLWAWSTLLTDDSVPKETFFVDQEKMTRL